MEKISILTFFNFFLLNTSSCLCGMEDCVIMLADKLVLINNKNKFSTFYYKVLFNPCSVAPF